MKRQTLLSLAFAMVVMPGLKAASSREVTIPERAKGAEAVVVAQVRFLSSSLERNEYGDQLIVSHLQLDVEETLKGQPKRAMSVDVIGGTFGGVTLRVSSLPAMAAGERAVFFLERNAAGVYVPHLRGQGILKLNSANRVQGSRLMLDDVRRLATGQER